jgi:hypothetical protein
VTFRGDSEIGTDSTLARIVWPTHTYSDSCVVDACLEPRKLWVEGTDTQELDAGLPLALFFSLVLTL